MDITLQLSHLCIFWMLYVLERDKRLPAFFLMASAAFYIVCTGLVWNDEWTYGLYVTKMLVDGLVAWLLLQSHTRFSYAQSFLVWMSAGLNLLAMIEWFTPSLLIYNAYGNIAIGINILQLFVLLPWVENLVYGVFRHSGVFYRVCNSMDLRLGVFKEFSK